tara:strand:+ start:371 stop:586 length:216 start_codon:yes stop_codon:yes gene_type:complete
MSTWIDHVKKVAKAKKISYKEAMSVAKASYKPKAKGEKKKMNKKDVKEKKDKKMTKKEMKDMKDMEKKDKK